MYIGKYIGVVIAMLVILYSQLNKLNTNILVIVSSILYKVKVTKLYFGDYILFRHLHIKQIALCSELITITRIPATMQLVCY